MDKFEALIHLASHAPEPSQDHISAAMKIDKVRNPHNDSHKPKLRDTMEIIVDYKFEYAMMLYDKIARHTHTY